MPKPSANNKEAQGKAKTQYLWLKVSRPEFLPANSASLVIGLAWGLTLPLSDILGGLVAPLILAFATISLVGAFAAHINTMVDYEFDKRDDTKKDLVDAMARVGKSNLKKVMVFELALSLVLLLILTFTQQKLAFILMWAAAAFLAYAYSALPLRLKSRSFAAPITLMIVLSILPVTFVTYAFTPTLDWVFFLFLAGQALTVYGVIIPAEIRDYFGDKAAGTVTMTVRLGLVKASLLGLALLGIGGSLCAAGFILKLSTTSLTYLSALLAVMAAGYIYVLSKYIKLLNLSRQLGNLAQSASIETKIVDLAAKNPKWITIVTQTIVFMSIVLLIAKILI